MALVQLTIAFQSFHAFSHDHSHEVKKSAKEFSALPQSHDDDDCHICDFHFDFFVAPEEFYLKLDFATAPIPYSKTITPPGTSYFAGSLFALRAPPALA